MTLDEIRTMRLSGYAPAGPVVVLIGSEPQSLDDSAAVVVVDGAKRIDWRPLVGLWVCLVRGDGVRSDAVQRVADGLQLVGVKWFGYVDRDRAEPLTAEPRPEHAITLRRTWESLCLC